MLSMYAEHRNEALVARADAFVGKGEAPGTLLELLSAIMRI
jgi:predicted Rossmann-fold nucleotide-binding protein